MITVRASASTRADLGMGVGVRYYPIGFRGLYGVRVQGWLFGNVGKRSMWRSWSCFDV